MSATPPAPHQRRAWSYGLPVDLQPFEHRQGGLSDVFLCNVESPEYREGHKVVAVKTPRVELLLEAGYIQLFLKEAFLWLSLPSHPNIIQAISAHGGSGRACIVLEYAPRSLRDMLSHGPLNGEQCVDILAQVCRGLVAVSAHFPGFIHQDLKPENILIAEDGIAKVTDFGLSCAADILEPGDRKSPIRYNAYYALIGRGAWRPRGGTLRYMAPEMQRNPQAPATLSSDIYSLGCLGLELMFGEDVFRRSEQSVVVVVPPRRRDSTTRSNLNRILDLLAACVSSNPVLRPQTYAALLDALSPLCPDRAPSSPPMRSARRLYNSAAGLLSLGLDDEAEALLNRVANESELTEAGRAERASLLSRIAAHRGQIETAAAFLEDAASHANEDVNLQSFVALSGIDLIQAAISEGQLSLAETLIARIPDQYADVSPLLVAKMMLSGARRDRVACDDYFVRAITVSKSPMYFLQYADQLFREFNDFEGAVKILSAISAQDLSLPAEFHTTRLRMVLRILEANLDTKPEARLIKAVAAKIAKSDLTICHRNHLLPTEILSDVQTYLQVVDTPKA